MLLHAQKTKRLCISSEVGSTESEKFITPDFNHVPKKLKFAMHILNIYKFLSQIRPRKEQMKGSDRPHDDVH